MPCRKKILVADCDQGISKIVQDYVQKDIFEIVSAYDGKSAIKLFYDLNPSLIILDLNLSGAGENDVCKQIRKISKVPIIIISTVDDEKIILESFENGADDYIIKPFSPKQLAARILAVLRRANPRAACNNQFSLQ